jgi:hypothetical protein
MDFSSDHLLQLVINKQYDDALLYCYNNDLYPEFKAIYLNSNSKFPIKTIVEMADSIENKSAKTYKAKFSSESGLTLDLTNIVLNEKFAEEYKYKLKMIKFVTELRGYSEHIYTGNKFYYRFLKNKYEDRIKGFLNF